MTSLDRRAFLRTAGAFAAAASLRARGAAVDLPFANGRRELIAYPEKRPLLRLTARPPQLETPFAVFDEGLLTPNDAFFVRYHLAGVPTDIDPARHRLTIRGAVSHPLELSVADLRRNFTARELVAVNQCSGNSRGFFTPRVGGGQLGNGAMGNARWTGVPLRDLLARAGVAAGARQVTFEGLDRPILPTTPEFVKALEIDHALDGEVMVAYAMNGADLPMLNGFPLRLIVPGYFGTYWVKHLADVRVLSEPFTGFWMTTAYRIPDNPTHSVAPGEVPARTVPIGRFGVRSFCTNLADGARLSAGRPAEVRGIAFDGGSGIRSVEWSVNGSDWRPAALGRDLGRYSFRPWTARFTPPAAGRYRLQVRATAQSGETQPSRALWNPSGYMRNVIESVSVEAT